MYMYLFLWCLFYGKKLLKIGFLVSVNAYVFIPMVLFLWIKIVKNCQIWGYMGMGEIFLFET